MIVATAGHVDHGKTLLIKALTGVDTDRLPEEKRRGLTIEPGFAYLDLGDGRQTGFVDVPGHERFIHNMLAGVCGIDCLLLVVAADDGVMPQTREHLAILDLLGIERGVVAITKIDRVDAARVTTVQREIETLLARTHLKELPILTTSSLVGTGIAEVKDALLAIARRLRVRRSDGFFRLAIDRNFVLPGVGRVVTGTVFSGRTQVGEQLQLASTSTAVRVRGIRVHDCEAHEAQSGQRCALNIAGIDLRGDDIHRGDWIVAPGVCFCTTRLDVRVNVLATEIRPLTKRASVHVHIGAIDVTGRMVVLGEATIAPGESGLIQLSLDRPVHGVHYDRVIIRDQAAQRTIGGGVILDPLPPTRGAHRPERLAQLQALDTDEPEHALSTMLNQTPLGVDIDRFAQSWNLDKHARTALLNGAPTEVVETRRGQRAFSPERWTTLQGLLRAGLAQWHGANSDRVGARENELKHMLSERLPPDIFTALVTEMLANGALVSDGTALRLPHHRATRRPADEALWQRLEKLLLDSAPKVPVVRDVAKQLDLNFDRLVDFMQRCASEGQLIRVSETRFFLPVTIGELARVAERAAEHNAAQNFSAAEYKNKAGIGRNAAIEILEYFDRIGFTYRNGQTRRLLKPAEVVLKS